MTLPANYRADVSTTVPQRKIELKAITARLSTSTSAGRQGNAPNAADAFEEFQGRPKYRA